jgi:UDP-N-acetylglucosamine transferase subunit ALG13
VLNELVPEALARALASGEQRLSIEIVHQTGHAMCEAVRARYAELGVAATVTPFIDDMARAYASAALVIGRAGATSLAELCAVGRPSILVPFPHAADDHQWHNAHALEQRGAAIALREAELSGAGLAQVVSRLLTHPDERRRMAEAARALGRPDAAAAIVDDLCAWLDGSSPETDPDLDGGDTPEVESDDEVETAREGASSEEVARFVPSADASRAQARRRARRRSQAWSHTDRYFGTRAVGVLE